MAIDGPINMSHPVKKSFWPLTQLIAESFFPKRCPGIKDLAVVAEPDKRP
jgi:hypothetical protein